MSFWQTGLGDSDYGLYHRADRSSLFYLPECLFVFVHGFIGNPLTTFGNLPQWTFEQLQIDADAYSFEYPTWPMQKADIVVAARDLQHVIKEHYLRKDPWCRHLIFVAHSTGGLVVKEALQNEWSDSRGPFEMYLKPDGIAARTRIVLNAAVAHAGANRIFSGTLRILNPLNAAAASLGILQGTGLLLRRRHAWGRNRLLRQLFRNGKYVVQLEQRYNSTLLTLDEQIAARPTSIDIIASSDGVIYRSIDPSPQDSPLKIRSDAELIETRGTHTGFKRPRSRNDVVVDLSINRLRPLKRIEAMTIADRTIMRVVDLDATERYPILMGDQQCAGSQKWAERHLLDLSSNHRRLIVTGDAGVGKSLVIRRLARDLAVRFLRFTGAHDPYAVSLPIVIPLQQVTLAESDDPLAVDRFCGIRNKPESWAVIRDWWCSWTSWLIGEMVENLNHFKVPGLDRGATAAAVRPVISPKWLDEQIRRFPTTVILDGVDEFIGNHDHEQVAELIDQITQLGGDNRRLTVIMGVRNGQPGRDAFGGTQDVIEVRPATLAQAEQAFPGASNLSLRVQNPKLRDLLLSPIFLVLLTSPDTQVADADLTTAASITNKALDVLIARMFDAAADNAPPKHWPGTAIWKDAAMMVAWRFSEGFRGEIKGSALITELQRMESEWKQHLHTTNQEHESSHLLRCFELLADPAARRTLLYQTTFFPAGNDRYRLRHEIWREFLVARYVADCIRVGRVEELRNRAFNLIVYRYAGELLGDTEITEDLVQSVLRNSPDRANQGIVGNFAAVIGNSRVPILGPAMAALFDGLDDLTDTARHVALNSFSHRALARDEGPDSDATTPLLRLNLINVYSRYTAPALLNGKRMNAVTRSLAWCYHKALAYQFTVPGPNGRWTPLGTSDQDDVDALELACVTIDQSPAKLRDRLHRSTQLGLLRVAQVAVYDTRHLIAAPHYLYSLAVAARQNRILDKDVLVGLPNLLREDSDIGQRISALTQIPELSAVYELARNTYPRH